jgi:hypothetical protein
MSVKKHEIFCGRYKDLRKHFSFVFKKYEGKNTSCFDMPDKGIHEQFMDMLEKRIEMGVIRYCKVVRHRKDPLVEVINKFVFIEDMFEVTSRPYDITNSRFNTTGCGNDAGCGIAAKPPTPEEIFKSL